MLMGEPEDLGTVAQPAGLGLRMPGQMAWIEGRLLWVFPKTTLSSGSLRPNTPPNYPNAAFLNIARPTTPNEINTNDGNPFAFIDAVPDAPTTELWPVGVMAIGKGETKLGGMAFVRRVAADFTYDVWTVHIPGDSTVAQPPAIPLFTGTDPKFSTGVYRGTNNVYVFACLEDTTTEQNDPKHFGCRIARSVITEAQQRESYRAYQQSADGSVAWVANLAAATPVLFGASDLLSVTFNQYLGRYLAVYSRFFSDQLVVQSAAEVQGPWREEFSIDLPKPKAGWNAYATEQSALRGTCDPAIWITYLAPTQVTGNYPSASEIKMLKVGVQ